MLVVVDDAIGALVATRRMLLPQPFTTAVVTPEFRRRMLQPLFIERGVVGVLRRVVEEAPDPAEAREQLVNPHLDLLRIADAEALLIASLEAAAMVTMNPLAANVVAASRTLGNVPVRLSPGNARGALVDGLAGCDVEFAVWDIEVDPESLMAGVVPEVSLEEVERRFEMKVEARRNRG